MDALLRLTDQTKVQISQTQCKLDPAISFADWLAAGKAIAACHESSAWWIGDWLKHGAEKAEADNNSDYGRRYKEALAILPGYSEDYLRHCFSVANRIPPQMRRRSLSWKHHVEVVSLGTQLQTKWLDLAEKNNWSVPDLRQAMRKENAEYRDEGGPCIEPPLLAETMGLERWITRETRREPPEEWPKERITAVLKTLAPVETFCYKLRSLSGMPLLPQKQ